MHSPALRELLDGIGLRNRLVRGAINMTVLVLVGVAFVIADGPVVDLETSRFIEIGLWVVSGGLVLLAAFARRVLLAPRRLTALLQQDVSLDDAAGALPGKRVPSRSVHDALTTLEPHELRRYHLAAKLMPIFLVSLMLHENLALLGLTLAFLTGAPMKIAPFALAALLLNLLVPEPSKVASEARG